jgi:hypothetical protein
MSKPARKITYRNTEDREGSKRSVIDRALDAIFKKRKQITAQIVLEEARNKASPLHRFFDWNDATAAEKHRLEQAYEIIRVSKFVVFLAKPQEEPEASDGHQVRKFINVVRGDGFKMRNEALEKQTQRQAFVEQKKSELRAWCRSVIDVSELDKMREAITKLL